MGGTGEVGAVPRFNRQHRMSCAPPPSNLHLGGSSNAPTKSNSCPLGLKVVQMHLGLDYGMQIEGADSVTCSCMGLLHL